MPYVDKKKVSIQYFIAELEIDLLAMVRYEHSFFEGLLREPVIEKVAFTVTVPFLVVPF